MASPLQIEAPERTRLKRASLLGYLCMAGGMIALFALHAVFSRRLWVIALQGGAVVLLVWARLAFGRRSFHATANPTAGGLVTTGPYRYIRHPIYSAVCLFALAGVAAHRSAAAWGVALLVVAGAFVRIVAEERLVAERYPEYTGYAARTWRLLPYVY